MSIESKIRMWVDNNEHFVGDEINEERAKTLDLMRKKCRQIVEYERGFEFPFDGFNTRQRNATLFLKRKGRMCVFDKRSLQSLSDLFAMADDAFITPCDDGYVKLGFGLQDMWDEFHYDNDMEHGE